MLTEFNKETLATMPDECLEYTVLTEKGAVQYAFVRTDATSPWIDVSELRMLEQELKMLNKLVSKM